MNHRNKKHNFESHVMPIPESGCWLWMGAVNKKGYGTYHPKEGLLISMHRWFYEKYKGPIPEGLVIDHKCRVRSCVNPDHLETVTNIENVMRGESSPAKKARQTHCKRGHLLSEDNLIKTVSGFRECKKCSRQKSTINNYAIRNGITYKEAKKLFPDLDLCRIS